MCKILEPNCENKGRFGDFHNFRDLEYPKLWANVSKWETMRKRFYCRVSVAYELEMLLLGQGGQRTNGIIDDVFMHGQRPVTSRWRHNRKFRKWPMTFETDQILIVLILWVNMESFGSIAHLDRLLRTILGVDSVDSEWNQKFGKKVTMYSVGHFWWL